MQKHAGAFVFVPLQPALFVGRPRLDGFALEGLPRLEVVGQPDSERAVAPRLPGVHRADESVAVRSDHLSLVQKVLHRERGGEPVAEAFLHAGLQPVVGQHPAVAQVDAALIVVREVDVEFSRQREGRRDAAECPVVESFGAVLLDALTVAHVGEVGVQLPPFRGLERQIDRDVIVFGAVVVDPCQLQQVGILRVGLYRLLNLAADELHAGREGVFVGGHQREVHVLLERRVERRVSRLVGVVRNLHPLGVEAPEARPFDGPGVLGDQRPSFLLRKGEGDVGVWKEREIILSDAFSRRVGVFAAQTSHEGEKAS